MEFKDLLRGWRQELGLTQMQLHDESKLDYHSIVAWERGKAKPSYDQFLAVCKFFGKEHPALDVASAGAHSRCFNHTIVDLREDEPVLVLA